MGEFSSSHFFVPPDPADRQYPVKTGPRPAPAQSPTQELPGAGEAFSVRTETTPAMVWKVDRDLRLSAGSSSSGSSLDDTGVSLYDHYETSDPDHPAIRAHRLALAGESVSYEMEGRGGSGRCGSSRCATRPAR
jgi:hypothetical protein